MEIILRAFLKTGPGFIRIILRALFHKPMKIILRALLKLPIYKINSKTALTNPNYSKSDLFTTESPIRIILRVCLINLARVSLGCEMSDLRIIPYALWF